MSADASVSFPWGDGDHEFRLPIKQLRQLQDLTGVGPKVLFDRLTDGTWMVDDVREVLRLGLIGGGMAPVDALQLINAYVDGEPLAPNVLPAQLIMTAALVGVPDDQPEVGEGDAPPEKPEAKGAKTSSPSRKSTARGRSSASPRKRSTGSRSGSSTAASRVTKKPTPPAKKKRPS